jgi:hypothetical protein
MKRIVCSTAIVGAALLLWHYMSNSSPVPRPVRLVPEEMTVTYEGDNFTRIAEFRIANLSDQPVQILSSSTSCGCTLIEKVPPVVPANASVPVLVQVSLPLEGSKTTRITFETDHRDVPSIRGLLVLNGKPPAVPFVMYHPEVVTVVVLNAMTPKAEPTECVIKTRETAGSPNWIGGVVSSDSRIVVEILNVADEWIDKKGGVVERKYSLVAKVSPDAVFERGTALTKLRTVAAIRHREEGDRPVKPLLIDVALEPLVKVVPDRLFFRVDDSTIYPMQRNLVITDQSEGPGFDAVMLKSPVDWIDARLDRSTTDSRDTFVGTIRLVRDPGTLGAQRFVRVNLEVLTDPPIETRLLVPVIIEI